jgi:hypothetical protein
MQRLFSMFPQGGPGVGLLLLRISVAGAFLYGAMTNLPYTGSHLVAVPVFVVAGMLVFGLLTPVFSVVAGALAAYLFFNASGSERYAFASFALAAGALALLGPGGFSLDARFFGRRVLVLPQDEDPKNGSWP